MSKSKIYFFKDKPLFGMDIGHDELRVMQLDIGHKKPKLMAYGSIAFDPIAINDGVIEKPELIAKQAQKLFASNLYGDITTKRVAVSLPASKAFTRSISLPKMAEKDIYEAVRTEVQQFISTSLDDLYLDYTHITHGTVGDEVFVVAMPKSIVDSYIVLTMMMGLEVVLLDTTIGASANLLTFNKNNDVPSVLVDFGAASTDITVYNHGLVVTGTVGYGGDDITTIFDNALDVSEHEAMVIKSKYGLAASPYQKKVLAAVEPSMELLIKEIRRTIRYYEQKYAKETAIGQIIAMGGGANMPGITDYLTEKLRLPATTLNPNSYIDFGKLKPLYSAERMTYVTAAGLAVNDPSGVFK